MFDRVRAIFNRERPHEALGQRTPASIDRPSPRVLPAKVESPEYPDTMIVKRLDPKGRMRVRDVVIEINPVIGSKPIGLDPRGDDTWVLYFGPVALATMCAQQRKVTLSPPPKLRRTDRQDSGDLEPVHVTSQQDHVPTAAE